MATGIFSKIKKGWNWWVSGLRNGLMAKQRVLEARKLIIAKGQYYIDKEDGQVYQAAQTVKNYNALVTQSFLGQFRLLYCRSMCFPAWKNPATKVMDFGEYGKEYMCEKCYDFHINNPPPEPPGQ